MRLRLLDLLVCPITKTPLKIIIWQEKKNSLDDSVLQKITELGLSRESFEREIISGALLNEKEKIYYPIYNGVPRLLTYKSGVFDEFIKVFQDKIDKDLQGYSAPELQPPVGEASVIQSFSKEWLDYDWDPKKYWRINYEVMYEAMEYLLDLKNKNIHNKLVLEVGIGIGGIADSISRKNGCELVGVDLSYAVDGAYRNFHNNLFFHIVQSSAFRLPFEDAKFDYIYTHGVLHHSSDPKTCFMNVSKLTKSDGYLYVWLYSDTSENRNLLRRSLMVMEKLLRPVIWPLPQKIQNIALFPLSLLYILHQNIFLVRQDPNMVKYTLREAYHAARDRFTPRYAFRYSEAELQSWFTKAGYHNFLLSSQRKAPNYITHEFSLATAIIGQKK
jgi:SAM-dependent methyltransferase/uncharacterized protein YbaR (Trm112 family)